MTVEVDSYPMLQSMWKIAKGIATLAIVAAGGGILVPSMVARSCDTPREVVVLKRDSGYCLYQLEYKGVLREELDARGSHRCEKTPAAAQTIADGLNRHRKTAYEVCRNRPLAHAMSFWGYESK